MDTLVRVALGSLGLLGLETIDMLVAPSTIYLLQYSRHGCMASCAFCPQSYSSRASKELVSRVPWPVFPLETVLSRLRGRIQASRVCLQTVLKKGFIDEALHIAKNIHEATSLPLSLAITPVTKDVLRRFRDIGVERIGIGLDAASPRVFRKVGKPLTWVAYIDFIRRSLKIFGKGMVHVHIIVGLGETGGELLSLLKMLYRMGAETALFAFTPIRGTPLEACMPPPLDYYRAAQIARLALTRGLEPEKYVVVNDDSLRLRRSIELDAWMEAFLTSGCPGCNRPFYNERPSRIYNYPSIELLEKDLSRGKFRLRDD